MKWCDSYVLKAFVIQCYLPLMVLVMVKTWIVVFWVKTPCGDIDGYNTPSVTCTPKMEAVGFSKLATI